MILLRTLLTLAAGLSLSSEAYARCAPGTVSTVGVTGLAEVVISVADLKAAVGVWRDVGGYRVVCRGDVSRAMMDFWRLPARATATEVVLRKVNARRGVIRLVRFQGLPQRQIRSAGMPWDTGGIYDVYLWVNDVDRVFAALRRRGWQSFSDPVVYTMVGVTVREVQMRGSNGEILCLMQQRFSAAETARFGIEPGRPTSFSWPFNAALLFADHREGTDFLGTRLGWTQHLAGVGRSKPGVDNPLGLPRNVAETAARRFSQYSNDAADRSGTIQALSIDGLKGRDFGGDAEPPNLGLLALRVPVPDLAAFEAGWVARGGSPIRRSRLTIAPFGVVDVAGVKAPNGARIELFSQVVAADR